MKTCTVFAASAVLAVISIDSAMGIASYLKQIPNGDSFSKELGHKGDSGYTDFGTAFSGAGAKWSADFCKQTFPGTSMTNGAAFGDPCCTWTAGGKADFTVTAFTDKPTQETKCASAATTDAPASTTATPSAGSGSSATPSSGSSSSSPSTTAPSSSGSSSSSTTPAPTTAAPSSSSNSTAPAAGKKGGRKCGVKKEDKDNDSDDDDNDNDDNDDN